MLVIEFDPKSLFPALERTKRQTTTWGNMAGSSALRAMKAEASRQIREKKNIKAARLSKVLETRFPRSGGPPVWVLQARYVPIPLADYGARQTRRGVSVMVNKGARKIIPGVFLATMASGHVGVYRRTGTFGRKPTRAGVKIPKRGPGLERIKELFSSTIADAFRDVEGVVAARGRQVFIDTFRRLAAGGGRKVASWETEGEHD